MKKALKESGNGAFGNDVSNLEIESTEVGTGGKVKVNWKYKAKNDFDADQASKALDNDRWNSGFARRTRDKVNTEIKKKPGKSSWGASGPVAASKGTAKGGWKRGGFGMSIR